MALSPRDVDVRGGGTCGCIRPQVLGIAAFGVRDLQPSTLRGRVAASPGARRLGASASPAERWPPADLQEEGFRDEEEEQQGFLMQEALSPEERRWAIALFLASGFDLLASACLAGFAFKYGYRNEGITLYCLGIQAVSHLVSSFVLTLRFMPELLPAREDDGVVSDECLLVEQRRRDLRREQVAAITMGIAMMVSSVGLLFKAFRKIRFWDVWYLDHNLQDEELEKITDLLAWWGFGGYLAQAALRFAVARRLRRSIAWHGFAVSVVSLLFFFALGLAASYEREWSWKAEPVAAIALVVLMLCESIRMVVLHMGDVETTLGLDPRA